MVIQNKTSGESKQNKFLEKTIIKNNITIIPYHGISFLNNTKNKKSKARSSKCLEINVRIVDFRKANDNVFQNQ